MGERAYTSSLQNQDRAGFSIIFRHPLRSDSATGKVGLRVRRGLATRDKAEAEGLKLQLDEILADTRYHKAAARAEAERRFDSRVVEIFYYKMTPEEFDPASLRDAVIELPGPEAGYRRVLLLGTTGAGKTTLLRQLIGTDPRVDRFPSTSTAKTTIHDTEIVADDGDWRAVVTFVQEDEVREYLGECISAAVLAATRGMDDATIRTRLLDHVNQRYRFSYVLGRRAEPQEDSFGLEDDTDAKDADELGPDPFEGSFEIASTFDLVSRIIDQLRPMAARLADSVRRDLVVENSKDERVVEEIFEEELDNLLREDDEFHLIADALMGEIERRFDLLPHGKVARTKQGWPTSWEGQWPFDARPDFISSIARFSSNHASRFGRLLTPLVNGLRVAGRFAPTWHEGPQPKLVLLDGEGLGHAPRSAASVATAVSRRIELADAVLLVDNAVQPMQAAPVAVMREVVSTGNARKLIIAFTHFDEVDGDNLPNASAKARHILASAENVLSAFGEEFGPFAERALRQRLDVARFFLADIDEKLSDVDKDGRNTLKQFGALLRAIDEVVDRPEATESRPVYDRMDLVDAINAAAESYLDSWLPRLGLKYVGGQSKEHWTRVRALSRRLATGWADEYDTLRPVADLRKELVEKMYLFFQNPIAWEGTEPAEDQKQGVYDKLADLAAKRLLELASRRVWQDRMGEWQLAFAEAGAGSTFRRAKIIGERIVEPAAPGPDLMPTPDRNQFRRSVAIEVEAAAEGAGAMLR